MNALFVAVLFVRILACVMIKKSTFSGARGLLPNILGLLHYLFMLS
jgi:hypothetical protein